MLAPGAPATAPGEEALGTPAVGTFKAPRELEIPDPEATERLRAQAVASERPVWNFDESAIEDAASRVRAGFRAMRDDPRRDRRGLLPEAERGRLEARLGAPVRAQDFEALARDRFSDEAEAQVVALAARALAGLVVEDASRFSAEEHGVVVRTIRGGSAQGEHVVFDLAIVRDVAAVREDVARAAEALPGRSRGLREAVTRLATGLVRPTLLHDAVETAERRTAAAARVKPVALRLKRGEKVVGDGEPIERRHLVLFRGIEAQARRHDVLAIRAGGAALLAALIALLWRYARRNVRGFTPGTRDALLLAGAFLGTVVMAAAGFALGDLLHDRWTRLAPEAFHLLLPFAAGAMIVRSVLSAQPALLFTIAAAVAVGLLAGQSIFVAIHVLLTGCAAAGLVVVRQHDRASLFRVGMVVGLLGAGLAVATHLFTGAGIAAALWPALAALGAGALLLPILAVGMLPVVELVFGYVTDVKLLELANLNHPALKDLIVHAPGTYHHSVVMGSLVEAAAEAIGANPLLARVCAYYHDIGKIRNPSWFAENQRGENRHDQAAPSMSAVIVRRHVTDGIELAHRWKLPAVVADVIPQHHGTRLVSFFHAKAMEAARAAGDETPLDDALYRYPGPRPQSVEAALVMIADACEASARALPEPSREKLRGIVERRVHELFGEGQLDECPLTLRDLTSIGAAMVRALEAVYHVRPDYPDRPATPGEGRAALQLVVKS